MSVRYVFPVLLVLLATQTAQATHVLVSPSSHDPAQITERQIDMPETEQPKSTSVIRAVIADSGMATGGADSATADAQPQPQPQPQSQASPSHPHHHTLRNILIITVAVGVMIIVLAAAAK